MEDRILKDLYGEKHAALLPKLVRVDIPFPGMRSRKFPGEKTYRIQRSQFFRGLDKQDANAIFTSILKYKKTPYEVSEDTTKVTKDANDSPWAPYLDSQRADYENIILQAERDWFGRAETVFELSEHVDR